MKLAIIGTGQLGSRHLQGISKINFKAEVHLIDPSNESLKLAKERFDQTSNDNVSLFSHNNISDLPKNLDMVIVSTNSNQRLDVIQKLHTHANVKYWILEKVLFAFEKDYELAGSIFDNQDNVWVNCPRRIYPGYQFLKNLLGNFDNIELCLSMPDFAIASNALHFIDLFAYLTNNLDMQYHTNGLSEKIIPSKRENYEEVTGTLIVNNSKGRLILRNDLKGVVPQTLNITTNNCRAIIQESLNPMTLFASKENNWTYETHPFEMPFQSDLTTGLIQEISENGNCGLPKWDESKLLHLGFIRSLKNLYKRELKIT